jgi:hypothetical protein
MPGFVTVLGTYHELQGSKKRPGNINDPLYVDLITDLIQDQTIDFIFEEATGLGPTTAEDLSAKLVGANRYLDLDPPTQKRQIFGIAPETNKPVMLGTPMSNPPNVGWANWQPIRATNSNRAFGFTGLGLAVRPARRNRPSLAR